MLSIIYRAYPLISKISILPFSNKDEQMSFCLQSVKRALKNIAFEFIFVSDGCTEDQVRIVRGLFQESACNYKEVPLDRVGNQRSFGIQLREASGAMFDAVLLLEDDYFVAEEDIIWNLMVLQDSRVQYTTFYYPRDASFSVGNMQRGEMVCGPGQRYTVTRLPSTTLTFFATKRYLLEDLSAFAKFERGAHDSSIWLRLTASDFWFLRNITRPLFRSDLRLFGSIVKRYLRYLLTEQRKRRILVYCGGGRSAHLDCSAVSDTHNVTRYLHAQLKQHRLLDSARVDAH
jgi:glycosyltransferase involved in cell wall biosynthesis